MFDGHLSINAIAKSLGINHRTAAKYARAEAFPERSKRNQRPGVIAPFVPYLRQRWEEGCRSLKQLLEEITERGYQYQKTPLWRLMMVWRAEEPSQLPRKSLPPNVETLKPLIEPRAAAWLLQKDPANLKPEETLYLAQLCKLCPELSHAYRLCQAFTGMVRRRDADKLDQWLEDAAQSNVAELKSFAKRLHIFGSPDHLMRQMYSSL